jgi:DNA-binding NtrC family response regulator
MSVLDERQQYDAHTEAHRLPEKQSTSLSRIEMLEELTLTLLEEITLLKDIQKLHAQDDDRGLSLPDVVRRFEIEIIRRTLLRTGGHQARAAHLLGVNATTLNAKLKRYHINPNPPFKTDPDAKSCDAADGATHDTIRCADAVDLNINGTR